MKPLNGLLVLSLEQAVAAPLATMKMVRDGARVIKVERPEGDFARKYDTFARGSSSYFTWLNAGKQSITADLKASEDVELIRTIASKADVFVQNLSPGTTEKLGIGSSELRKVNKSLITLDITGYSSSDKYEEYKAYDLLVAAEAGLCSITGSKEAPSRVGISVCDILCGLNGYSAVLKAIMNRSLTGEGVGLKVSLFGSVAEMMAVPMLHYRATGKNPERLGLRHPSIAPYGSYATKDGRSILISIQNEVEWKSLCLNILKINPDLEKFSSSEMRLQNRGELEELVQAAFVSRSTKELKKLLLASGIAFGEVNDMAKLWQHPSLTLQTVMNDSSKEVCFSGDAISTTIDKEEAKLEVPIIGQHTNLVKRMFRN